MIDNEEPKPLCPNCGSPGNAKWTFCAHCGLRLIERPYRVWRAIGFLVVGMVIVAFGAFGACFTLLGFSGESPWGILAGPAMLAFTIFSLVQFAGALRKF